MGLFGKMFDKKTCDICGGEIGLLGNRKLEDGNLCKECAKKLSPWMTDRRQSTVEEIRQHLAYREMNRRMLANIHPGTVMGGRTKVYIDEGAGKFFVTASNNWRDQNPDIIDFGQVIDVQTNVTEHRTEQYHRDREGHNVPFNPPRYRFSYEFTTKLLIDSPYFNEISFELTEGRPENRLSDEYRYYEQLADALHDALMPAVRAPQQNLAQTLSQAIGQAVASFGAAAQGATQAAAQAADESWTCACGAVNTGKFCTNCGAAQPADESWTCACGAVNTGKFCTNCGAKRPEPKKVFRCDKCGWTPEDPANPPRFCPNCGDPFNETDAQ